MKLSRAAAWLIIILFAATAVAAADGLSVPVPECAPVFQTQPDGTHISAADFATVASPGDPSLPFKDIYIILPPNADPSTVSVSLSDDTRETVSCDADIAPAPPIVTVLDGKQIEDWGRGKRIEAGRNVLVYGANAFYPATNVEVTEVGNLRKWRIATVRYYPFRYNPVTRELDRTTGGRICVSVLGTPSIMSRSSTQFADNVFADKVKSLAANYTEAQSWYAAPRLMDFAPPQTSEATANYVILTTSTIVSGSSKLQAFVNHKTSRGFSVEVVTQAQWGSGSGDTAANKIRAYLQANYIAKGIEYVLLIGNPNPTSGDVPMKMLWPRYSAVTYREAPSDYYYADLTGNWDLNGNGFYGEENGDFGPGGIDRLPEVIVGRIPFCADFTALDSILQKTIDYESGVMRGSWVRNVLLSMKPSDSSTPGYQLGEAIRTDAAIPAGMTTTRVYESNYGLNPPPQYTPCSYSNVLSAWQQHTGFHFWWTHGNETLAADVINPSNCQYLDDAYPSFTFQCSCLNGSPENTDTLQTGSGANAMTWTPKRSGVSGPITLTIIHPGTTHTLSSTIVGNYNVQVTLGYSGGALVSTANDVVANVNSTVGVKDSISAVATGTGTGIVAAISETSLTNLGFSLLKRGAIATDSATRVSWYYPGETTYTNTDSNAGMTYQYAVKLVRDHMPCGDAHFAMMVQVPNNIWMNHCVFNIYGDPSVAYPAAPVISHNPLPNTDIATEPYLVQADVSSTAPLVPGSPALRWRTAAGADFEVVQMTKTTGTIYQAYIPAQSYGTTVYYYIEAMDAADLSSTCPFGAPNSLLSFEVAPDTTPPVITHTPLLDTGNKFGPYPVAATVTDNMPIQAVRLHYNTNAGPYIVLDMAAQGKDVYAANIPGPTNSGDTVNYYITATDTSLNANTSRLPSPTGCFSFMIAQKVCVALFDSTDIPPYFSGGNTNAWSQVNDVVNADPLRRFQVSVLTSLKTGLTGQDVLVLPDNAVPTDSLQAVADWFQPGKVILALDSAACYAAYTGWMWPGSTGMNGYSRYLGDPTGFWDYDSGANDQNIWIADPITAGYSVGQVIGSVAYDAQYYVNKLPADAHPLSGKSTDPTSCYAVYRDVPGRGRIVLLGPFLVPLPDQYSMIREALIAPPQPRQVRVTSPNGGETYEAGDIVTITHSTSGAWDAADRIRLEYCTGLDGVWRQVPGAESLPYSVGSHSWNTSGLPGSHGYRVRAGQTDGAASDESDAPFSIVPTVSISEAKALTDGSVIRLAGKVVTCTAPGFTYVEEPNRRAGIRVTSTQGLYPSALVDITGVMSTLDGERVLGAETTATLGVGAEIGPYALKMGALGGAAFGRQDAVMEYRWIKESGGTELLPAFGLNNIGLLVRVWGKVTAAGADWFYIDDGSACNDGSGNTGVKVFCPGITPPATNQFVVLNAISSTYFDRGALFRALVVANGAAVQSLSR